MYETDELMYSLNRCLRNDLHASLGLTDVSPSRFSCFSPIREQRAYSVLLHDGMTPYQYKIGAQINSFLKRYVFKKDLLTPRERERVTDEKFIALQLTLAQNYWKPRSVCLHEVLRRARSICTRILRNYNPEGCDARGQFGTKATVGCPASQAYIDAKLLTKSITGSVDHIAWAKKCLLPVDSLLADIVEDNKEGFNCIANLAQVNVPKKYNIDRGINPNTLLGSFYTSALGRLVEEALRAEGLDIKTLQNRHKILARRASTKGRLATADLSNASHGFLSNLLNALLPRKWYHAIMRGVIRNVEVNGRVSRLESIMTMGIGFTFPMQTLLFYCLLCALSELSGIKGTISVYGDDLIYPVKLHKYVAHFFPKMGFQLNLDKTFVSSPFKESCGSDFFRGVDVRPYSPEGVSEILGKMSYVAFCYKILNGLLRKWNEVEIPSAVMTLKFEITRLMGQLYVVPENFPDHSGWKIAKNAWQSAQIDHNWWIFPIAPWRVMRHATPDKLGCAGLSIHPHLSFPFINAVCSRHIVTDTRPYYWDFLRSKQAQVLHYEARSVRLASPLGWYVPYRDYITPTFSIPDTIGTPALKYKKRWIEVVDKEKRIWKTKMVVPTVAGKPGEDLTTRYVVTSSHETIVPRE